MKVLVNMEASGELTALETVMSDLHSEVCVLELIRALGVCEYSMSGLNLQVHGAETIVQRAIDATWQKGII